MNKFIKLLSFSLIFVLFNISMANVIKVPENRPTISLGIQFANDGDTVSVWGDTLEPPPYIYRENLDIKKNILVVNRSFIKNMGCPPSPVSVIIDGNFNGSVVAFGGVTHDAILRGFTIQHAYGEI